MAYFTLSPSARPEISLVSLLLRQDVMPASGHALPTARTPAPAPVPGRFNPRCRGECEQGREDCTCHPGKSLEDEVSANALRRSKELDRDVRRFMALVVAVYAIVLVNIWLVLR